MAFILLKNLFKSLKATYDFIVSKFRSLAIFCCQSDDEADVNHTIHEMESEAEKAENLPENLDQGLLQVKEKKLFQISQGKIHQSGAPLIVFPNEPL